MIEHRHYSATGIRSLIRQYKIEFSGNRPGKIYGNLGCVSGKRMKKENRVFFTSEEEAVNAGYRPCGRCMPLQYKRWKESED